MDENTARGILEELRELNKNMSELLDLIMEATQKGTNDGE